MTNEPTNTLNTKTVAFPLPLYKDALTRAMKNADDNWFKSLFALSDNNPDFILNEEGQTVWMLWNQICNEEKVKREEKSVFIDYIMKNVHADDCNYLYTLYKRGGVVLLEKITDISTNININAHDENGFTVLDRLLIEENVQNEDIAALRQKGYRFGLNLLGIFSNYFRKSMTKSEPNSYYAADVNLFGKRFDFLDDRIHDAIAQGISGDFGRRLVIYEDESDWSRRQYELIPYSRETREGTYMGIDPVYFEPLWTIKGTTYITLNEMLNHENLTIDGKLQFCEDGPSEDFDYDSPCEYEDSF